MSDWFYKEVPEVFRSFEAMRRAPQHDFQRLTKRLSDEPSSRADVLRQIPARVRFISVEPWIERVP